MKRSDITDDCPEEFAEQLNTFLDHIEYRVREIRDSLDISGVGDLQNIESAYDDAKILCDDLY